MRAGDGWSGRVDVRSDRPGDRRRRLARGHRDPVGDPDGDSVADPDDAARVDPDGLHRPGGRRDLRRHDGRRPPQRPRLLRSADGTGRSHGTRRRRRPEGRRGVRPGAPLWLGRRAGRHHGPLRRRQHGGRRDGRGVSRLARRGTRTHLGLLAGRRGLRLLRGVRRLALPVRHDRPDVRRRHRGHRAGARRRRRHGVATEFPDRRPHGIDRHTPLGLRSDRTRGGAVPDERAPRLLGPDGRQPAATCWSRFGSTQPGRTKWQV
ncbi:hypothetical protein FRIGORI9N_110047 [Frigoribacterium sp. 9N]|nr:hypothetical protein FRIGORI9N_110047 [Frigoribacterium sp. 9N]